MTTSHQQLLKHALNSSIINIIKTLVVILVMLHGVQALDISTSGTYDAKCTDVFIRSYSSIVATVYNPLNVGFKISADPFANAGLLFLHNNSGLACASTPLTISSDHSVLTLYGSSLNLQFSSASATRSVVFASSITSLILHYATGQPSFTATARGCKLPAVSFAGTTAGAAFSVSLFNGSRLTIPSISLNGYNHNIGITGIEFHMEVGSISDATFSMSGVRTLTFLGAAVVLSSSITLSGQSSLPIAVSADATASRTIMFRSSSLIVRRPMNDLGGVVVVPPTSGVLSIVLSSSSVSFDLGAAPRNVSLGGNTTVISLAGSTAALRFTMIGALSMCSVIGYANTVGVTVTASTSAGFALSGSFFSRGGLRLAGASSITFAAGSLISTTVAVFANPAPNASYDESLLLLGPLLVTATSISFATLRSSAVLTMSRVTLLSDAVIAMRAPSFSVCSGGGAYNELYFAGAFGPSASITVAAATEALNVTMSDTTQWSGATVSITYLSSTPPAAVAQCPSNLSLAPNASLLGLDLTFSPYLLGNAFIGGHLANSSLRLTPWATASTSPPARVTIQPESVLIGASHLSFIARGVADTVSIPRDVVTADLATLAVVVGSPSSGCSNRSVSIASVALKGVQLTATYAEVEIAAGATFTSATLSWTPSGCPRSSITVGSIELLGGSTLHISSSTPVTIAGVRFLGTANTLHAPGCPLVLLNVSGALGPRPANAPPSVTVQSSCNSVTFEQSTTGFDALITGVRSLRLGNRSAVTSSRLSVTMCDDAAVTVDASVEDVRCFEDSELHIGHISRKYLGGSLVLGLPALVRSTLAVRLTAAPTSILTTLFNCSNITDGSLFLFAEESGYHSLTVGAGTGAAPVVVLSSRVSVSARGQSNTLGTFGTLDNATVLIENTATDQDVLSFINGPALRVTGGSVLTLKGRDAAPSSAQCSSADSTCSVSLRSSAFGHGNFTAVLSIPALHLAVPQGTTLTNATITALSMKALSVAAGVTLAGCALNLISGPSARDDLSLVAAGLVLRATSLTWAARFLDALSLLVTQARAFNGTTLRLGAVQCGAACPTFRFGPAAGGVLLPTTTLELTLPTATNSTAVAVAGLPLNTTLRVWAASLVTVGGLFSADSALRVAPVVDLVMSYPSVEVSQRSLVTLDLTNLAGTSSAATSAPFAPKRVDSGSRLEVIAPRAQAAALWNVTGEAVLAGSVYLSVPLMNVRVSALAGAGSAFTITSQTLTTEGAALASGVDVTLTVLSAALSPPALNLGSLSSGGYDNVTMSVVVAAPGLADSVVAGKLMRDATIAVVAPACASGCGSVFTVDGSLMTRSSVSVRVQGRAVRVVNANITGRFNSIHSTSQSVQVLGSSIDDATVNVTIDASSLASPASSAALGTLQPSTLRASNLSVTILSGVRVTQPGVVTPGVFSVSDNALFANYLNAVAVGSGSSLRLVAALVTTLGGGSWAPLHLAIPDAAAFAGTKLLTVRGDAFGNDTSLLLSDVRSDVSLSGLGGALRLRVGAIVVCRAVALSGAYTHGASLDVTSQNISAALAISSLDASTMKLLVTGASLRSAAAKRELLLDNVRESTLNVSINDCGLDSEAGRCVLSLGAARSSAVSLEACTSTVTPRGLIDASVLNVTARRVNLTDPGARFSAAEASLYEHAASLQPATPYHFRAANGSHLRLVLLSNSTGNSIAVDASGVASSTVFVDCSTTRSAPCDLALAGVGASGMFEAHNARAYAASGAFARASSVLVHSTGRSMSIHDATFAEDSVHNVSATEPAGSIDWATISVGNVSLHHRARPQHVFVLHGELAAASSGGTTPCAMNWAAAGSAASAISSELPEPRACLLHLTLGAGLSAATTLAASVPAMADDDHTAMVRSTVLRVLSVGPADVLVASGVGSFLGSGLWRPGSRVTVDDLQCAFNVSAILSDAALTVRGAAGSTLQLVLGGSVENGSAIEVHENATDAGPLAITDLPLCSVTAAISSRSSVLLSGVQRRWYPGGSAAALYARASGRQPVAASGGVRFELSLIVSAIAILPRVLEHDSVLTLANAVAEIWLEDGRVPPATLALRAVEPQWAHIDNGTLDPESTSFSLAGIAVSIPPAYEFGAHGSAAPTVAVVNASFRIVANLTESAAALRARVSAISATIPPSTSSQLRVVDSAVSVSIAAASVDRVAIVDGYLPSARSAASAPRSSVVLDWLSCNVSVNRTGEAASAAVAAVVVHPQQFVTRLESWVETTRWVSYNVTIANATTTCVNVTATIIPRPPNATTAYNCSTSRTMYRNVTGVEAALGGATRSTLSVAVVRAAMRVLVVPDATPGDVLPLRRLVAVDLRDHYNRSLEVSLRECTLSLALVDAAGSAAAAPSTPINSALFAPLVWIENGNSSMLHSGTDTAAVVLRDVLVDRFSSTALFVRNSYVSLLSVNQSFIHALRLTRSPGQSLFRYEFASLPSWLVTVVSVDTSVLGQLGDPHPAMLLNRTAALVAATAHPAPSVAVTVRGSAFTSVSALLATAASSAHATFRLATSSLTIYNTSLTCAGGALSSVVALSPYDAFPVSLLLSSFVACGMSLRGGEAVFPGGGSHAQVEWSCNEWDGRYPPNAVIRSLHANGPVFGLPEIATRVGEVICRSPSASLDVSASQETLSLLDTNSSTISGSLTFSFIQSATVSRSMSASPTSSSSLSLSPTVSASHSRSSTSSCSLSASGSPTGTDTPSISIDPCNTTFRPDSDGFVRHATVLTTITEASELVFNTSAATFLVLDRVALATIGQLRVQFGFNTYLRNFYYETSVDWFPMPLVSNCIIDGFDIVNATDFALRISYDPDVSLRYEVDDPYVCNLTFSTDIFQCQLMTNFSFNFSAAILVTGTPKLLTPAAEAATKLSTAIITLLSGGAALLQQSRADSLTLLASCQFSLVEDISVQESPTQLGFGSELQYFHRGCVLGNLAVVAAFALLVFAIALVAALACRRTVDIWSVAPDDETSILAEDAACAASSSDTDDDPFGIELGHLHDELLRAAQPSEHSPRSLLIDAPDDDDLQHLPSLREALPEERARHESGADQADAIDAFLLLSLPAAAAEVPAPEKSDAGADPETPPIMLAEHPCELPDGAEASALPELPPVQSDSLHASSSTPELLAPTPSGEPPATDDSAGCAAAASIAVIQRPHKRMLRVTATRREYVREALRRYCAMLSFPSVVAIPFMLLADSTTLSAVRLLVHPIDEHDLLIGSAGVVVYGIAFVVCCVYTGMFVRRVPTAVQLPKRHPLRKAKNKVVRVLRYWLVPTTDFASVRKRDRHTYGMMHLLFEDSRYPAFVCCDLALSLLVAALVGVGISRREVCVYLAGAGAFGYLVFFVLVVVLRPNVSRLSLVLNITGSGLGLFSATATFVSMYNGNTILTEITQYVGLVMMAVSMLQFVATVVGVAAWVRNVGMVLVNPITAAVVDDATQRSSAARIALYRDAAGHDVDSIDGSSSEDDACDLTSSSDGEAERGTAAGVDPPEPFVEPLDEHAAATVPSDDDEQEMDLFYFPSDGTGVDSDGVGLLLDDAHNTRRTDHSMLFGIGLCEPTLPESIQPPLSPTEAPRENPLGTTGRENPLACFVPADDELGASVRDGGTPSTSGCVPPLHDLLGT